MKKSAEMPFDVHPRIAFRYRDFRFLLASNVVSMLGMQMQSVAVGWQVYDLTHRPLDLGWVGLAQFLPAISLSLVAGHTADRYDRRSIVRVCQLVLAFGSILLWAIARSKLASPAPIYAILVLLGTARAFQAPAQQALLPHLVPAEHFSNAVTWSHSVRQVATIAGPAVGGLVYGWANGASAVYAACATLLSCAAVLTSLIRARTGRMERRGVNLTTLLAGVRYVFANRIVLGCISLDLFAVLLGGAVALLPVFARDILHAGPAGLGLLRTAPAGGAALMGSLLVYRPLKKRAGGTMLGAVGIFGVATIVFGLSRTFALSFMALFVAGAADMVSVVIRLTLVQLSTPSEMRGRVSAVNMAFINASNELGEFESGVTAALWGAVPAVIVGGIGTCVVVSVWAWLFPELRKLQRLTDSAVESSLPDASSSLAAMAPVEAHPLVVPVSSPSSRSLGTAEVSAPPAGQSPASTLRDRSK
jgi:MFS family permease